MSLLNFLKSNTLQFISAKFRASSVQFGDVEKGVDNVNIVLNKLTESYLSGELNSSPAIKQPNFMSDWMSLETRWYYLYKYKGVGYLYFKDTTVFLLDNSCEDLQLTFKTNATVFNTLSFMEALDTATYKSHNSTINLLADGGEIVPIYDLGMDNNFQPISRLKQIEKTTELADRTLTSLIGAMKRTAMAFIFKRDGTKARVPQDKNDQKIKEEKDRFEDSFAIGDGAVQLANQPLDIAEANPDNRKLQALEIDRRTQEKISTQLGYAHTLLFEDAKYDNAEVYINAMTTQTIIPDNKKYSDVVMQYLGVDRSRTYTLIDTQDGQEANQETQEGDPQED